MFIYEKNIDIKLFKITGSPLRKKKILFLENHDYLVNKSVINFRRWCIENRIQHECLFRIDELGFSYLSNAIFSSAVLVFQTTGANTINAKIKKYLLTISKMKIIECYDTFPYYNILPKGVRHQMWVLDARNRDMAKWHLEKLNSKSV